MNSQQSTGNGPFSLQPSAFGRYVGLISGTSMDGIDAALIEIGDARIHTLATRFVSFDNELVTELDALVNSTHGVSLDDLGQLDTRIGQGFAAAALELIDQAGIKSNEVRAIGSHGQTIRHRPGVAHPFTMQIGDPNVIAAQTGIATVADFRRKDVALGGEGAPLLPAFHSAVFGTPAEDRLIVNIGGIANITRLLPGQPVTGYDTGPGNTLLDSWMLEHRDQALDSDGAWAASGTVDDALLGEMKADKYFARTPPKSTGREYFNQVWVKSVLERLGSPVADADVQATLAELTASTIADAAAEHGEAKVFVCGGGVHNLHLMGRLDARLGGRTPASTTVLGVDPDFVEAAAFAWLAARTLGGQSGNLPTVTGAREETVLGGIYPQDDGPDLKTED